MFDFLRKKMMVPTEDVAANIYLVLIKDAIKKPEEDIDGNIILDENEQRLILLSHLCKLLEAHDLKKVKWQLLSLFVRDNRKIKGEEDLALEMLKILDRLKKIDDFFNNIPKESHEFVAKDWIFKRNLNPIQKIMIMPWYVEHTRAITSTLESILKKIVITNA